MTSPPRAARGRGDGEGGVAGDRDPVAGLGDVFEGEG